MRTVRPEVRAFFEHYERAGDDPGGGALTDCFCDTFLSLDPNSATTLSPRALVAVLPRRKALFQAIGSDGLELVDLTEAPLDEMHTLVRTSWKLLTDNQSRRDEITFRSTFLLRKQNGAWRIALYLNHQDMPRLLGELAART